MEKEIFDYVAERAQILTQTGASKQETKDAAQAWLDVVAADESAAEAATETLLAFLDGRPNPIDGVIAFAEGPAKQILGEEVAAGILADSLQRKAEGKKFCGCEACTAASEILAKFGRVEL